MKRLPHLLFLCLIAAALTAAAAPSSADPTGGLLFVDSGQSLGNAFSTGVALADVDGDGDPDAVVANGGGDASLVWVNQGGAQGGTVGVFAAGQALDTLTQRGLAAGDLDGDGDPDILLTRAIAADSLQVWINQGGAQGGTAGAFVRNAFTVDDQFISHAALGDVDGDGDLDAYLSRIFDVDLVYLNDGTGLFADSGQELEPGDTQAAALADLDGDGDPDAFAAVGGGANAVWINQGGAQGGTAGVFLDSGQALGERVSLAVALADLDGDGDADAFVANATENLVWLNQGGAQGGAPGVFQVSGQLLGFSSSLSVALGDLDGDGDLDAFVGESEANSVWVNQGGAQGGVAGQFADSGLALGASFSRGVALGDVDGDGDPDAFVANSGPAPNRLYLNNGAPPALVNPEGWQIQLVAARGLAGYSPSIALDSQGYPHIAHVKRSQNDSGVRAGLYHDYWDGVRWHSELVDAAPEIEDVSLALDSSDRPQVAYAREDDPFDLSLYYAHWDGAAWQMEVIDAPDERSVIGVSLALDSSDRPHVSYKVDGGLTQLTQYAAWGESGWQIQTIDYTVFSGGYTSLALDGSDRPHVAYLGYEVSQHVLSHAFYDGTTWQISVVEELPETTIDLRFFSLDVFADAPAIAYYDNDGERLSYAVWDDGAWQRQQILTTTFPVNVAGNLSLAIDSAGNPQIAYALDQNIGSTSLRLASWDGQAWQNEILDNSGSLGLHSAIAVDTGGTPHVAYQDQTLKDLRYVTWAPNWQIRPVAGLAQVALATDIAVTAGAPYVAYHNSANGLVGTASWDDAWATDAADAVEVPVPQISLATSTNRRHLSYYDADAAALMYGYHDGVRWNAGVVDGGDGVDAGRYQQLVLVDGADTPVYIVYWDETVRRVKLAARDPRTGTFERYANTAGPALVAGSGPLSAAALPGGRVGIVYYDAVAAGLRYAVWEAATATWSDEPVPGTEGGAGRFNAMGADATCGCPVVAAYDEVGGRILLAVREAGGWQVETAAAGVTGLTGLALELSFDARERARIAYLADGRLRSLSRVGGAWQHETIVEGLGTTGSVGLTLDERAHLAFADALAGAQYVFRTATLEVDLALPLPPAPTGGYNPLTPCPAIVDFFFDADARPLALEENGPPPPLPGWQPLTDGGIYAGMAGVFGASAAGQGYIDLYAAHAAEMGRIGLDDPALLWDAFGTLQNFLPGLEALVTGRGDRVVVTQAMVDDALDIWTRLAAAAGPELTAVIQGELAQYNQLQDFVGLTFADWARAIGVEPPGYVVYGPAVWR